MFKLDSNGITWDGKEIANTEQAMNLGNDHIEELREWMEVLAAPFFASDAGQAYQRKERECSLTVARFDVYRDYHSKQISEAYQLYLESKAKFTDLKMRMPPLGGCGWARYLDEVESVFAEVNAGLLKNTWALGIIGPFGLMDEIGSEALRAMGELTDDDPNLTGDELVDKLQATGIKVGYYTSDDVQNDTVPDPTTPNFGKDEEPLTPEDEELIGKILEMMGIG